MDDTLNNTLEPDNERYFDIDNSKTYLLAATRKQLLNFALKRVGIFKSKKEEEETVYRFEAATQSGIFSRRILLDSSDFKTRDIFWKKIKQCVDGKVKITVEPLCNAAVLSKYCSYLDLDENNIQFTEAPIIGFYKPNLWVLSDKVHIEDDRILPDNEKRKLIRDRSLTNGFLEMKPLLITSKDYCRNIVLSHLQYSNNLKSNKYPFMKIVAFAALKLLNLEDEDSSPAGETKYAALRSEELSIGKSTIQVMVARGCGVPSQEESHFMMISGGDGQMTGTSRNLQDDIMSKTNMIVFSNEMDLSSNLLSSSLQQSHEKYFSTGSVTRGFVKPKSALICSSNEKPNEKLNSRLLVIDCYRDYNYSTDNDADIHNQMMPCSNNNVGWILAWCVHHKNEWKSIPQADRTNLFKIISNYCEESRMRKCLTNVVLVVYLLSITAGDRSMEPVETFKKLITPEPPKIPFCAKTNEIVKLLIKRIKSDKEATTWFNPVTSFKSGGRNVPCIAANLDVLQALVGIKSATVRETLSKFGKEKTWNTPTHFFRERLVFTAYLVPNGSKKKQTKAGKIPWKYISQENQEALLEACNIEKEEFPQNRHWQDAFIDDLEDENNTEDEEDNISDADKTTLRTIFTNIATSCTVEHVEVPEEFRGDVIYKNLHSQEAKDEYAQTSAEERTLYRKAFKNGVMVPGSKRKLILESD